MIQRGGSGLNIYNAQRIVAENKTSARQLQASGVFQDQQPGKRSLLELLAAAREVQDWALYASILKNIRRRLNVSYGLKCVGPRTQGDPLGAQDPLGDLRGILHQ